MIIIYSSCYLTLNIWWRRRWGFPWRYSCSAIIPINLNLDLAGLLLDMIQHIEILIHTVRQAWSDYVLFIKLTLYLSFAGNITLELFLLSMWLLGSDTTSRNKNCWSYFSNNNFDRLLINKCYQQSEWMFVCADRQLLFLTSKNIVTYVWGIHQGPSVSYRIPLQVMRVPLCTVGTTGTIWG